MKKLFEGIYEFNRDINPAQFTFLQSAGCAPHFHHQMEILYVHKGALTVAVNGEKQRLRAGGLCVSDSYDVHSFTEIEAASENSVIIISKSDFPEYCTRTKNKTLAKNFCGDSEVSSTLRPLFLLLRDSYDKRGNDFCKNLVAAILSIIADVFPYKKSADIGKAQGIRNILSYIHEHLDEDISLNSLSRHFGYTPTHFSHIFNNATGFHLREFVNTLRVQHAPEKLRAGDSVLSAALDCGFTNTRTFYSAFKRLYGVSPMKYAKDCANI